MQFPPTLAPPASMTPEEAQSLIGSVLCTHDIPLPVADLAWAFTQDRTSGQLVEFAQQYLIPDCLLGLEEAEM